MFLSGMLVYCLDIGVKLTAIAVSTCLIIFGKFSNASVILKLLLIKYPQMVIRTVTTCLLNVLVVTASWIHWIHNILTVESYK